MQWYSYGRLQERSDSSVEVKWKFEVVLRARLWGSADLLAALYEEPEGLTHKPIDYLARTEVGISIRGIDVRVDVGTVVWP